MIYIYNVFGGTLNLAPCSVHQFRVGSNRWPLCCAASAVISHL